MTRHNASYDREARIELVRARSALERQRLLRGVHELSESLRPSSLVRSLLPRSVSRKKASNWLMDGVGVVQRYPLLTSGASAVLARLGKRNRWLRLAGSLLLSWQFARSMVDSKKERRSDS